MSLPAPLADYVSQAVELGALALGFFLLAWLVKGARAVSDARAAAAETRTNVLFYVLDVLTVGPWLAATAAFVYQLLHAPGVVYQGTAIWSRLGPVATGFAAIFICDFLGYCNHRLFHTRWLWPSHVVHHSDTRLTWLSLLRLHPFDRLGTLLDLLGLVLIGMPDWAIALAVSVRHYYGHLIHADLPWTLGRLDLIFVSPAMHRWHHAREQRGSGVNFATVFSVFDRLFGTFYASGVCHAPTGVDDAIAPGWTGLYLHPLRTWGASIAALARPAGAPQA